MTEEQITKIDWLNRARILDEDIQTSEAVRKQNIEIQKRLGKTDAIEKEELKIKASVEMLESCRNEISAVISAVENKQYQNILKMRYLGYMKMDAIAAVLHKELRTVQRNHKKALDEINIPV